MHDFNPGIAPNGLFWTVPISMDDIQYDLKTGDAVYRVRDLQVRDFHHVANGGGGGPSDPGVVSFDIRWRGISAPGSTRGYVKDSSSGARFAYDYIEGTAQIAFQASAPGFSIVSDPIGTSNSSYAVVGREWNGVFFPQAR